MSNVVKLTIKGIRSFSPDRHETIQFFKPLTLIVGHNGAGKTTIIECLKMACTGDLPPNVKSGQNFIHDPNVAGESQVKAQIKLMFKDPSNITYIVMRIFQVTLNNGKLQYKALDNTLSTVNPKTNQTVAIPRTCAVINQQVPLAMGVSKAILENVIFVHQEDSNWPLMEAATVKKRFDDIFAATKYTKALEEIRKMKTKQVQDAKESRLKLETLKTHRDHAKSLKRTIEENEMRSNAYTAEIDEKQRSLEKIDVQIAEIRGRIEQIQQMRNKSLALQAKYDLLMSQNEEALKNIESKVNSEDLGIPVEELEGMKDGALVELSNLDSQMEHLERMARKKEAELGALMPQREAEFRKFAKIEAETESYLQSQSKRNSIVYKCCTDFNIPVSDVELSEEEIFSLKRALLQTQQDLGTSLKETKERENNELESLQSQIGELNGKIFGAKDSLRSKEELVQRNSIKASELQKTLEDIYHKLGKEEEKPVETDMDVASANLALLEDKLDSSTLEQTIKQADEALASTAQSIESLRVERRRLAALGTKISELKFKQGEIQKLRSGEGQMRQLHGSRVAMILGIAPRDLPHSASQFLSKMKEKISERESERSQAEKLFEVGRLKLSKLEEELESKRAKLREFEEEFMEISNSLRTRHEENLDSNLICSKIESLERSKKDLTKQALLCDIKEEMLEAEKQAAINRKSCLICNRAFENQDELQYFLDERSRNLQTLPFQASKVQKELEELESQLASLKILEPDAKRCEFLHLEIPETRQSIIKLTNELESTRKEVSNLEETMKFSISSAEDAADVLHSTVNKWAIQLEEISRREEELKELQKRYNVEEVLRTVEDVDKDLSQLEAERASWQQKRDQSSNELSQLQKDVALARNEIHKLRESSQETVTLGVSKVKIENELKELLESNEWIATDAAELQISLSKLEEEKRALQARCHDMKSASTSQLSAIEQKKLRLEISFSEIQSLESILAKKSPLEQQKAAQIKLQSLEESQSKLEKEIREYKEKLQELAEQRANNSAFAQQIDEILSLKASENEAFQLKRQLEESGIDFGLISEEKDLLERLPKLEAERASQKSSADMAAGSLASVLENISVAKQELKRPEFNNIDARYITLLTELHTTELANSDLEKYYKALERALLSFHASKMADINKTMKELWQKTYRGIDIDYIQIKADTESKTGSRSSYNYRVVMYVGAAELDMRGRCSAGQRVLACLIIRLALAETFCFNCGILTLDEPTTNLDAENAASLAEALKALMIARKDFESFQLIVITHDENFARRLGSTEFVEEMYRIKKDETQHSLILTETIG